MAHPMGESKRDGLRVDFDRRLKLEFHGSKITSDGGLLAYRELDDALGLTEVAGTIFQDSRTGKNGWHGMTGQFRQSVFARLGGYEDVNDADRLGRDPAMRWIVGGKAVERQAASTGQMGRFETELLATDANIEVLAGMNGAWIDKVHDRRPPKMIILDMDSSVSPTHGEQEGTAYNGHFGCTCYHPLFLFNQFGDLERCSLRPGNVHSADGWREVLEPVVERYRERNLRRYFRGDAAYAAPDIYEFLESEGFLYAIRLPKPNGMTSFSGLRNALASGSRALSDLTGSFDGPERLIRSGAARGAMWGHQASAAQKLSGQPMSRSGPPKAGFFCPVAASRFSSDAPHRISKRSLTTGQNNPGRMTP